MLKPASTRLIVAALLTSLAAVMAGSLEAGAQTRLKPGMNMFSLRDDINIGRRSASEIDRRYRTYHNARLDGIGRRLASRSSMPSLPWRFRVIERRDANAFALPGGYIYVTSGLLRTVRSDSELAGVLAHEITHVTLRHGTNQASKAMLAQMPLQLLGAGLGGGAGGALARMGISFGLNTLFLRYSRTAETQADLGAVQVMRRSGYDPAGLITFLQRLGGSRSEFFSDHPNPSNRINRIRREIGIIGRIDG
jgi:predicted Zn-dependent protease